MKIFKRISAAVLVLCMAVCLMPMMPAKAAYTSLYITSVSNRPTLYSGEPVSAVKYANLSTTVYGYTNTSVKYSYEWTGDSYSYGHRGLSVWIENDSNGIDGTLWVETDRNVAQGNYTLKIVASGYSNGTYVDYDYREYTINVYRGSQTDFISTVYLDSPEALTVGQSYGTVRSSVTPYDGEHYTIKSRELYAYDSNAKTVTGESSIKGDRIYRLVLVLDADYGYRFEYTNDKSSSWSSGKSYYGSVYTSGYTYGTAVFDDGDTLYVGLEYRVSSEGTVENANSTSTVTAGGKISTVDINVTGGVAKIGEIGETVARSAANASNASNIVIDLSGQRNQVESALFSYGSFVNLANAVNSKTSNATGVEIRYPNVTASLDGNALYTISSSAYSGGKNVTVSAMTISTSSLSEAQKSAISGKDVIQTIRAKTTVGTSEFNSFGAGVETISFKYSLPAGRDGRFLTAYHVDSNGKLTAQQTSYANGYVSFKTNHNSDFVIIYDVATANVAENTTATTPVYRAYNPTNGDHLFTVNSVEYNTAVRAGWKAEGIVFNVRTMGTQPVYRLYFKKSGEHLYTISATERTNLQKAGWVYEGVSFYSGGTNAVFRLSNPNQKTNNHLFTTDATEKSSLVSKGWKNEDVAFYVN